MTKQQLKALERLRNVPEERPTGFAVGTGGWDVMMRNLAAMGLVEVSPPDEDGRSWATITDAGLQYEPPKKKRRVYSYGRTVTLGDLTPEQQAAFWEKQRQK